MAGTDGSKIDELPQLVLPVRTGDLNEVIKPEPRDHDLYGNFGVQVAGAALPMATTEKSGKMEIATLAESLAWVDGVVITPEGVFQAVKEMLENSIVQGSGMILTYDDGAGTLTIARSAGYAEFPVLLTLGHASDSGVEIYGFNSDESTISTGTPYGGVDPIDLDGADFYSWTVLDRSALDLSITLELSINGSLTSDYFHHVMIPGLGTFYTASADYFGVDYPAPGVASVWVWPLADVGDFATLGDRATIFYIPI